MGVVKSARHESEDVSPSPLGKPLKFEFSGVSAPNRFLKGSMTERQSSWDPKKLEARGVPSKELINLYRRWGEGGIGNILTGNIMIEYDQLEAAGNPIITRECEPSGERFERFKELAAAAKKHGSLIMGQLSHPGRQTSEHLQPHPISASDVQLMGNPLGLSFAKPRPATEKDIARVIDSFAHGAQYLEKAGYDGVELHGAHGYLLAQFLSQTTNKRTDKYGGSIDNRARLIVEIAQEIRKRTQPNFVVGIKLNSVEFQDGGFTPEEAKQLCGLLEENRVDFVELSGGTYEKLAFLHQRESTQKREAYFLEFASTLTPALKKTRSYLTGGFKTVGAMVHALDTVDGVGLARPLCQEPHLCADILTGKVKGAIKMGVDENDFGLTNIIAGTQMKQIGKDKEPIDMSKSENVEAFKKDMGKWMEKMSKNTEGIHYGYVDIESSQPVPYGSSL
ncbi:FMN-linked oxidoreductase [Piedraia hortae CBS 480.64]|uniref:FMN-linked oxidoreductase n=1 Tax=Piedraia hortae CBS 480.64 TaxID=1314780 RepID=A0A6A7BQ96_9PEZI|nr:FMN-linked oxidoreductase [Piedraia hortae CBS 480.64]